MPWCALCLKLVGRIDRPVTESVRNMHVDFKSPKVRKIALAESRTHKPKFDDDVNERFFVPLGTPDSDIKGEGERYN